MIPYPNPENDKDETRFEASLQSPIIEPRRKVVEEVRRVRSRQHFRARDPQPLGRCEALHALAQ